VEEIIMDNRFSSFNKAKQELQEINYKVKRPKIVEIEEKKKTYSFTLLPSERRMLAELAEESESIIKVSDSQLLGSIIREKYNDAKH
jgi:predicted mannosyl-3-phosphoglycerate phosphatase (HAD superfamily)